MMKGGEMEGGKEEDERREREEGEGSQGRRDERAWIVTVYQKQLDSPVLSWRVKLMRFAGYLPQTG